VNADGADSWRTRRGLQTRGALLRSGRHVLEQRGYHRTRIADITKGAGTSVGTFYLHFTDKEDLFRNVLAAVEDEVYGELTPRAAMAEDPLGRITETNGLYLRAFHRNARFWRVVEEAALSDPEFRQVMDERRRGYRLRTARAITRWQTAGLLDPDLDAALAAEVLGAMTERCAYHWFVFGAAADADLADLAQQLTQAWANVLGLGGRVAAKRR
jgi:AcrR family transcriptional regulator